MQQSTKITLIVVGAVASVLLIVLGIGMLVSNPPMATADGFQGIGGFFGGIRLVGYMLLICGAACTLLFVAVLLRMMFRVFGDVATAIEWLVSKVRDAWQPAPLALDTVLRIQNGQPVTLGDALQSATSKIKAVTSENQSLRSEIGSLRADLVAVVARTAHIEPPPPPPQPKTAEEIAAEQAEIIANLQRKLEQMQKAQQAKSSEVAS